MSKVVYSVPQPAVMESANIEKVVTIKKTEEGASPERVAEILRELESDGYELNITIKVKEPK